MTNLRRLDPQPADLTTHKGPFVDLDGKPATLLSGNIRNAQYKPCLWSIEHTHTTELIQTEKNGRNIIFAAEEIREPIVYYKVYDEHLNFVGSHIYERNAKEHAAHIGGTIRRFVEDTSYGGGV